MNTLFSWNRPIELVKLVSRSWLIDCYFRLTQWKFIFICCFRNCSWRLQPLSLFLFLWSWVRILTFRSLDKWAIYWCYVGWYNFSGYLRSSLILIFPRCFDGLIFFSNNLIDFSIQFRSTTINSLTLIPITVIIDIVCISGILLMMIFWTFF